MEKILANLPDLLALLSLPCYCSVMTNTEAPATIHFNANPAGMNRILGLAREAASMGLSVDVRAGKPSLSRCYSGVVIINETGAVAAQIRTAFAEIGV